MQISRIASFLVSPGKNMDNPPDVSGAMLPLTGRLYNMLNFVFEKSDVECNIPIRFVMAEDGSQNNETRNKITAFIDNPGLTTGKVLARRLSDFTTQKPGLALFFLIIGNEGNRKKLVLSRFPADEGIVAETHGGRLQVDYIERVFMKNRKYYKAALYQGTSTRGDFWSGNAVDKQLDKQLKEIADYWIFDFLESDFETTSKAGTRRFALALRNASAKAATLEAKQELSAFSILSRRLAGRRVSIGQMVRRYNISEQTRDILVNQLSYQELADETFLFDEEEFAQHVAFTSVELDNGGMMTAPQDQFDKCFRREIIDDSQQIIRFITEGRITDERIRGRK